MSALSHLSVSLGTVDPIYRQIVEQVRRRVAGGQLKAGDELPSVREVAQALTINPMTVSKAFGVLVEEGLVTRRRGKAMVIADHHLQPTPEDHRVGLIRPTLVRAAHEAQELGLPNGRVLRLLETIMRELGRRGT